MLPLLFSSFDIYEIPQAEEMIRSHCTKKRSFPLSLVPTVSIAFATLATKFDRLRFIAQSSPLEHSHQLLAFNAKLIAFYKVSFSQV